MPKVLTISERFLEIRSHFNLTRAALGEIAGLSGTSVTNIEGGVTKNPGVDVIEAISKKLDISPAWLLTGEGEMLKSEHLQTQSQNILSYTPDQNVKPIDILSNIPVVRLRRLPFRARASFNYQLMQRHMNSDIFEDALFRLPTGKTEADYSDALVIDIEGDSMEESLQNGDKVIAWPIPPGKWEYLHSTICMVNYDDTVTVKAIIKNDLFTHDSLTLVATGGGGGSFTVGRSAIHSIWEVREFFDPPKVRLKI